MRDITRKISKDVYDAAKNNNGVFANDMLCKVFSPEILYGCGLYNYYVFAENGDFFLSYTIGDSCD